MKDLRELRTSLQELIDANEEIVSGAKKELRKMTDIDEGKITANLSEITKLKEEIRKIEDDDKKETNENKKEEIIKMEDKKVEKRFSLIKAIRDKVENRQMSEETVKVIDQGKNEFRKAGVTPEGDILLPISQIIHKEGYKIKGNEEQRTTLQAYDGGDAAGAYAVGTDQWDLALNFRESLVAVKAGAKYITGLVGDISLPKYSGSCAAWKGEVSSSQDIGNVFSEMTLAPKRLTAYIDISKQLLVQDSVDVENMIKQDMLNAIAGKLETTIFGSHASNTATQPDGLFTGYATESANYAGALTWKNAVGFEKELDAHNFLQPTGKYAYITNPNGRYIAKTTLVTGSNSQMILEDNEINGYPVHITTAVPNITGEAGVVFGDFSSLIIGQWGGLEILVDPYSQAISGKVRLVCSAYLDFDKKWDNAFEVGSCS